MASLYVDESGATAEQAAKVAVKARRNACRNPHSHLKMPDVTVEDVLASDMLAYPVRKLDMCPSSDGACAVLFASDEDAGALAARPAWVTPRSPPTTSSSWATAPSAWPRCAA